MVTTFIVNFFCGPRRGDHRMSNGIRALGALAVGGLVPALAACGSMPEPALAAARSAPGARPRHSIQTETQLGATRWEGKADPDRLAEDAQRAARDMQWGVERVEGGPMSFGVEPHADAESKRIVRMWAILSDGRGVVVVADALAPDKAEAGRADEQPVAVSVRVGRFGDPVLQEQFLAAYRERLSGKRARQFGGSFIIPAFKLPRLPEVGIPGLTQPDAAGGEPGSEDASQSDAAPSGE